MPPAVTKVKDQVECPLCLGEGNLKRAVLLQRLGMADYARVAQLSAEEAMRLLLTNQNESEQGRWSKFEAELTKRLSEATAKYNAELQSIQGQKNALTVRLEEYEKNSSTVLGNAKQQERLATEAEVQNEIADMRGRIRELEAEHKLADQQKETEVATVKTTLESALRSEHSKLEDRDRLVKDYLVEISQVRERNEMLTAELAKVARVGKKEEVDFAEEARTWPGICVSEKLPKHGDYILTYRGPSGAQIEPRLLVDNKDKSSMVTEGDVDKLIRDAKERGIWVAVLLTKDESQLRSQDKEARWGRKDEVWMLRTTRHWLPRDLEVLKPVFETMRAEGPDFLAKNSDLADQIRRTFIDLDEMEKELKKATKAIECARGLTSAYRARLQTLCDSAVPRKVVARMVLSPDTFSAGTT